ncbi:2'-5' RNA ligase superfamily protein [Burkholderia pseudomallei MSHR684]|nr:2'-5' RNA ligase superfamily protein [Burkholderia pseudomallei MSHR684]
MDALTVAPRRYGWHATLVAPFALRPGVAPDELVAAAAAWARACAPLAIDVDVAALGAFVALRPAHAHGDDALRALAARALRALAPLRRPPADAERAKRAAAPLSERQRALLAEWGYPYVLDEYRFHMTLSDPLDDPAERAALIDWWKAAAAALGPLPVDHAAIFVEARPGTPFMLWKRLPFGQRAAATDAAATTDAADAAESGEARR